METIFVILVSNVKKAVICDERYWANLQVYCNGLKMNMLRMFIHS